MELLQNYYEANLFIGEKNFGILVWSAFAEAFSLFSCTFEHRSDYELANLETNKHQKDFLNTYLEPALEAYEDEIISS